MQQVGYSSEGLRDGSEIPQQRHEVRNYPWTPSQHSMDEASRCWWGEKSRSVPKDRKDAEVENTRSSEFPDCCYCCIYWIYPLWTDDVISRRKNRMLELKMWDDLATRFPRSQRKGGLTHKGIQHTGPTARNLGVRIAKKWTTLVRVSAKHHTIAIYQKKRKKFARMGRWIQVDLVWKGCAIWLIHVQKNFSKGTIYTRRKTRKVPLKEKKNELMETHDS